VGVKGRLTNTQSLFQTDTPPKILPKNYPCYLNPV
jgi:hypothetical protein